MFARTPWQHRNRQRSGDSDAAAVEALQTVTLRVPLLIVHQRKQRHPQSTTIRYQRPGAKKYKKRNICSVFDQLIDFSFGV